MRLQTLLLFLIIGGAALLPRVADLGSFITHDEAEFWIHRSHAFLEALQHHNYAETAITTHPGVVTMWLGSAGILLRQFLFEWGILQHDPFPLVLALLRLPAALTHVVGILVGTWLLRRLLPPAAAFLAALLWALDPFITGYSRLLHVDALAGTFATLSLLAACAFWYAPDASASSRTHWRRLPLLLLSGVCAALAVLSKSPALVVVPVVATVALTAASAATPTKPQRTQRESSVGDRDSLRSALAALLLWGGVFALTVVVVWPAVWADPYEVYNLLRIGVVNEGAQPHMTGNFFLGQRNDAPGLRYYPVALALRLTPWAMVGLFLLPAALAMKQETAHRLRTVAVLVGFVLLFVLAMSLFPKKFNRYLVLVFPAVDIVAAVGLAWGIERVSALGSRLFTVLVVLAAVLNAVWWHPYGLAAFNQVLGGARAGADTFSVGWGEGYEQVAAWLNAQPDSTGVLTISRMITSLNPYLDTGVQAYFPSEGRLRESAGYVVVYVREVQGGAPAPPMDQFYGQAVPLHVVSIHGVPYAWIYQVPPPVEHARAADVGDALHLRGFDVREPLQPGQQALYTLVWEVRRKPPADYWLFARVVGEDGQHYAQVDMEYATSTWQAGRFEHTNLPITLPTDAPPGSYRVVMGLYAPATGERLPLSSPHRLDPSINGPDTLLLTTQTVPK